MLKYVKYPPKIECLNPLISWTKVELALNSKFGKRNQRFAFEEKPKILRKGENKYIEITFSKYLI